MNELIVIEGTKLQRIEYRERPVVTLAMIAQAHQKQSDDVWKNFDRNRERFIEGEDYVVLPYEEWSSLVPTNSGDQNGSLKPPLRGSQRADGKASKGGYRGDSYLFFDSGYLMLVKTFTDDLSWRVQRGLVRHYFSSETRVRELKAENYDLIKENQELRTFQIAHTRWSRNPISEVERRTIIALKLQGKTSTEIRKETGRSQETICRVVRRARKAGEIPPLPTEDRIRLMILHPELIPEVL